MSLVLAGTADSITYVLDAAPATNQLPASIYYALQGGAGNQANTLSAGTTPVTILAGSGAGAIVVNSLVIPNRDTATRIVTVNMVTGSGTFEQVQVTLTSGSHLNYSSGNGWYVMDKNGNFLSTVTVTGGTSTVNQGTANTLANAWPVEVTDGTNVLGVAAHPLRVDPTGTTTQPVSGTVTANAGTGNLGVNLTQLNSVALGSPSNYGTSPGAVSVQGVNAFVTNTVPVSQSGTWNVGLSAGANNIGSVNQGTSPWVVSLASTTITGTVAVTQSTSPWTIQGDSASGAANAGNPVKVGGVFNTTQPTVTSGQTVDAQATARGARIVATGVDTFTVSVSNFPATQPISGTVAATQSGTWTVQPGNTANTTAWLVTGTGGTFPTTPPVNASTNITQFGGVNLSTGTGASGTGIPRVTVSNDSTHPVTQSGTWTVQPGNTANTTAWLVTGTGGTFPTSPPANASTNVAQWGGSATTLGQKTGANSVPVVMASDYQAGAANAFTGFLNPGTMSFTFGSTATKYLNSITITVYSLTSTTNTVFTIKDPSGATLYTATIPVTTSMTFINFVQITGLAIPMAAGGSAPTASISPAPTGGGTLITSVAFT